MKTKTFLFVSRLAVLTLACAISIGFAGCNKDDDGDGGNNYENWYEKKILGTWVCDKRSYSFNSDGTGMYDSGGDVGGSFTYNLYGSTVYLRIVYGNSYGNVWRDEISGSYNPDNDTFWIYGDRFVRKK